MKFNRVYNPILTDLETEKDKVKRYVILKGGAGAGKSRAISQCLFKRLIKLKGYNVLCMKKEYSTVERTLFNEFKKVIKDEGYNHEFKITKSPFKIEHIPSGNEITFGGMDDSDKLKSLSGINCIWLEEADQFDLVDFQEADTRLREDVVYPIQLFISFNPTSETSWLKPTFFDPGNEYEEDSLVIETTFRDNYFIDKVKYGKVLYRQGAANPNRLRVMMNGEWGRLSTDGLFYKQFESTKHVKDTILYNPELPLWISWDFNVVPSCTCLVFQLQDDKTLWQIDEFQARSPNNNTAAIARSFKSRYSSHRGRVYVTGDPAGRNRDTRGEEGRNDYTIIQNELADFNLILRVPNVAPNQISRGDFINAIFFDNWEGLDIQINFSCKKTITDLTYQRETATGKDKKKIKDKETGATYEQYGHCSDAFDYLVYTVWTTEYEKHKTGPKKFDYMFGRNKISSKYR